MLKVEGVKRHFVNTFLLKFIRNDVGERGWGVGVGVGMGGGLARPLPGAVHFVFCALLQCRGREGKCRSLCQRVYSEARVTTVFSVSAFCFTLLYI